MLNTAGLAFACVLTAAAVLDLGDSRVFWALAFAGCTLGFGETGGPALRPLSRLTSLLSYDSRFWGRFDWLVAEVLTLTLDVNELRGEPADRGRAGCAVGFLFPLVRSALGDGVLILEDLLTSCSLDSIGFCATVLTVCGEAVRGLLTAGGRPFSTFLPPRTALGLSALEHCDRPSLPGFTTRGLPAAGVSSTASSRKLGVLYTVDCDSRALRVAL